MIMEKKELESILWMKKMKMKMTALLFALISSTIVIALVLMTFTVIRLNNVMGYIFSCFIIALYYQMIEKGKYQGLVIKGEIKKLEKLNEGEGFIDSDDDNYKREFKFYLKNIKIRTFIMTLATTVLLTGQYLYDKELHPILILIGGLLLTFETFLSNVGRREFELFYLALKKELECKLKEQQ
ncbi:hypothetical protein DALLNEIH_03757 [Bacillus sp. B01(2024)]